MSKLPKYAALKSKYNHKYLRYLNQTCSPVHTFLQYSSDEILTPFTKFEFEQAVCDPCLYHIKCCYSNKYWSSLASDHHFIVAGADIKQEDKSKWNCTLFRPVFDTCNQSYRFCHVKLGFNVVLWRAAPPYNEVLRAQWSDHDKDHCDLNIVINWDSLIMLPKHVAFKGDNGCYLSARLINNLRHLQFSSNCIEDGTIWMETFTTKDGKVRIKSIHCENLWKRGTSNWILADTCPNTPEIPDTLFSPTKLAPNVVALCNLGNGNFVKRYTTGGKSNLLNALIKEPDAFSHLEVIELVRSRKIHNVKFHSVLARFFGGVRIASNQEFTNNTNCSKTVKFTNFSNKNDVSSTWSSSCSTKLDDVKTKLESEILVVGDGKKIEILPKKFSGEYKWGETIVTSLEKTFEVIIPPMHTITAILTATSGRLVVPFSYHQTDILISGKTVEYFLEDGVYNVTNFYDFDIRTITKPLCGCPN